MLISLYLGLKPFFPFSSHSFIIWSFQNGKRWWMKEILQGKSLILCTGRWNTSRDDGLELISINILKWLIRLLLWWSHNTTGSGFSRKGIANQGPLVWLDCSEASHQAWNTMCRANKSLLEDWDRRLWCTLAFAQYKSQVRGAVRWKWAM